MPAPDWAQTRKPVPSAFNKNTPVGTVVSLVLDNTGEWVHSRFHQNDPVRGGQFKFWGTGANGKAAPVTEDMARTQKPGSEPKPVNDLVFTGTNPVTGEAASLWVTPSASNDLFVKIKEAGLEAGDSFVAGGTLHIKLMSQQPTPNGNGWIRQWMISYQAPAGFSAVPEKDESWPPKAAAPSVPAQSAAPAAEGWATTPSVPAQAAPPAAEGPRAVPSMFA